MMDLNMPFMGGFEATKKIKERGNPYIVALSASNIDYQLIQKCQKAGFDDWFVVPLSS